MKTSIDHLRDTPIVEFLDILSKEGFSIGVDTHIYLQQLLKNIPPSITAEELKKLLAPIIAKNEEEQNRFYTIFDEQGGLLLLTYSHITSDFKSVRQEKKLPPQKAIKRPIPKKENPYKKYIFLTVILLLTSITIFNFINRQIDTSSTIQEEQEAINLDGTNSQSTDVVFDDHRSNIIEQLNPNDLVKQTKKKDLKNKVSLQKLDTPDVSALPNRLDNDFYYKLYTQREAIRLGLFLLAFCYYLFSLIKSLVKRKRNDLSVAGNEGPASLPIQINKPVHIDYDKEFYGIIKQMNIRQQSERKNLDIPKTIHATIENAGLWDFQYAAQTKPVEYLFLIDQASSFNYQSRLFDHIYQTLKENDVLVDRYFFKDIPLQNWNEKYPEGFSLSDLHRKYKNHYLLIFSDGQSFIDGNKQQLKSFFDEINYWEKRALLTPNLIQNWPDKEMPIFQASLDGLVDFIDMAEGIEEDKLSAWKYKTKTENQVLEIDEDQVLLSLDYYFEEELQVWIAACALYPELNWDLTMHLGQIVANYYKKTLLTQANIFKLSKLKWFQDGKMPDAVRSVLLVHPKFPLDLEVELRKEISKILKESMPDEGTMARETYQMRIAINELFIHKKGKERDKYLELYRQQMLKGVEQDLVSIKRLTDRDVVLADFLPKGVASYVFKHNNPLLGTRRWVGFAAMLFFGILLYSPNLEVPKFEEKRSLDEKLFSLYGEENKKIFAAYSKNFLFNQGVTAYDENKMIEARNAFSKAIDYEAFADNQLYEGQLSDNDQLVNVTPDFYNGLASSLYYLGKEDKAKELYEKILQIDEEFYNQNVPNLHHVYQYDFVDQLHDGFVRVAKDGKYGFLNEEGKLTILLKYDQAQNFYQQVALVKTGNRRIVIDISDQIVESVNRVALQNVPSNRFGIVVNDHLQVSPPLYDDVYSFHYDYARVKIGAKYGYIDRDFNVVIPIEYDNAKDFDVDNAAIVTKGGFEFWIDPRINAVEEHPSDEVLERMQNDRTIFIDNQTKLKGYKDKNGDVVIDAQFDNAFDFGNANLARVQKGKKWGYINRKGQLITPFKYDRADGFYFGLSKFMKNKKFGFINEKGEEIYGAIFDFAHDFASRHTVVRQGSKYGIVSDFGIPITAIVFDEIGFFNENGETIGKIGDKRFLINMDGQMEEQ